MRCIPSFEGKVVDWIPVDVAARCIGEVLLCRSRGGEEEERKDNYAVHNIVNPSSVPWSDLIPMLERSANAPTLEVVSMTAWVARLSALSTNLSPDELPGLKLLQFFENMALEEETEGKKGGKGRVFKTEKTRAVSKALGECRPFSMEWLQRNFEVWRDSGFL